VGAGDSGIWTDNLNGKSLSNFNPYGLFFNPTFIDQDYTATEDDTLLICNGGAIFNLILPPVGNLGKTYVIKNISTFNVEVYATGADTIDGAVMVSLVQYDALTVVDSGTEWLTI
jgi:hypothetical protein